MIARLLSGPAVVALLLASAGCISDLSLPSDPKLICGSDADCPNGLVCNGGHVCVPSSYKDQPPPDLQAAPVVEPAVAKSGDTVRITVLATQPMKDGPTIVLHLSPFKSVSGCQGTADRLTFTCSYTLDGSENGGLGGVVPFDVQIQNDLRVVTLKSFAGAVNMDFQAPTVVPRITPEVATLRTTLVVDLLLSEPLSSAPVLTALNEAHEPANLAFTMTKVSATRYTFSHLVTPEDHAATVRLVASVTDLAGNAADVDVGSVTVVPALPKITGITLDTLVDAGGIRNNTFSAAPGFNLVKVDFNSTVPFDEAPATFTVAVGGRPIPHDACTTYLPHEEGSSIPNYSCTFTVTPALFKQDGLTPLSQVESEVEPITVTAIDSFGTTINAFGPFDAVFDLRKPSIVAGSTSLSITPPPGSAVARPTAMGLGSVATIRFAVSEELRAVPGVAAGANVLTFAKGEAALPAYAYTATLLQPGNDGTIPIQTVLTDVAGNKTDILPIGTVVIDTTAPVTPSLSNTGIVYTRAPWGRQDGLSPTTVPSFSVSAPAASVEPSAWIRIYDGPDASTATLIHQAEVQAAADGSFGPIELTAVDRAAVYLGLEDDAGNASAVIPVKNVKWIGSLSGSIATQATNPTLLLATPTFSPSLDPEPFQATEVAAGQTSFTVASHGVWRAGALGTLSPTGRGGSAVAFDTRRGVAVLTGGDDANGPQSDTWEWDGGSWTRRAVSSPPARTHAAIAYNARLGTTVLFGGWSGGELGDTWTYDGVRWSLWRPPSGAATPPPRRDAAMAYNSARGTVVLFGGRAGVTPKNDVWEFDGTSWVNQAAGSPPSPRSKHTFTYYPTHDTLLLFGGQAADGQDMNDTYELTASPVGSGVPWSWASKTSGATARDQHTAWFDPAINSVVIAGGRSNTGTALGDTWRVTGTPGTWTAGPSLPVGRIAGAATYDPARGEAVLFGGSPASGPAFAETWAFNGTRWADATPSPSPAAQQGQAVAFDEARGVTVSFGGRNATGIAQGSTWTWNGRRWFQPSLASQPTARTFASLTYDRVRGKLVLFGGLDAAGAALDDTWEWDGGASGWTKLTPTTVPPARSYGALGFWCAKATSGTSCDATTAVALLTGGVASDGAQLHDVWTWSGTNWTQKTGATLASGRSRSAMAFDASRFRTVMFGGLVGEVPAVAANADTFEWDGTIWSRKGVTNPPVARVGQAMGYDSGRGRVVLFGGTDTSGLPLSDDYSWDGTSWLQDLRFCVNGLPSQGLCDATGAPVSAAPPGRAFSQGAFDTNRNRFVVFGGNGLNGVLGDTWELANDPASAPAALVAFDFASVGSSAVAFQQPWVPFATFGGAGNSLVIPGTGTPAPGARLYVWDFWTGGWVVVGSTTANTVSTGSLVAAASLPLPGHIIGTDGLIHFAVVPLSGQGNGVASSVGVKDVQLTMSYKIQ